MTMSRAKVAFDRVTARLLMMMTAIGTERIRLHVTKTTRRSVPTKLAI